MSVVHVACACLPVCDSLFSLFFCSSGPLMPIAQLHTCVLPLMLLQLFIAGDQLLKGAALNAVQIAELLLTK